MPEAKIVELYDGQITAKFHEKGHKYFIKENNDIIEYQDRDGETIEVEARDPGKWRKVPSVTTITKSALDKPQLYNWFVDSAVRAYSKALKAGHSMDICEGKAKGYRFKKMRKAGKIGSDIHEWAHAHALALINGTKIPEVPSSPKAVTVGCELILNWIDEYIEEFIDTEHIVYHPLLDIIGTTDFVAKYKSDFYMKNKKVTEATGHGIYDYKSGAGVYPGDLMQISIYRETYCIQEGIFPDEAALVHIDQDNNKITPWRDSDHDANLTAFECAFYLVKWRDSLNF